MLSTAYRYFYAVAQERSIRKAADRVHISASAMSRQIGLLEEELGQQLLERRSRGIVLTEAGDLLTEHVRKLMLQEQELRTSISELNGLKAGHVRLALGNGFAASVSSIVLPVFAQTHPGVTFSIVVTSSDEILRSVDEELVDFGLTLDAPSHQTVEVIDSFPAPLCAIVPAGHTLIASKRGISLTDLQSQPLALLRPSHRIRQILQGVEVNECFRLRATLESNSYEVLRSFVSHGLGVTVLPKLSVMGEIRRKILVAIPLRHSVMEGTTASIVMRRGRKLPVAAAEFIRLLKAEIGK